MTKCKGLQQSLYIPKKLNIGKLSSIDSTKANLNLGSSKCVNGDKEILFVSC